MKENREDRILLGGEFNGRKGERGARNWEEERGHGKRKSKDKVENAEGKRLMEWIEENGWEALNGNKQGDEEGGWTYVSNMRETVMDYGRRTGKGRRIQNRRERAESDHLEMALRKEQRRKGVGDRSITVVNVLFLRFKLGLL
jgi:hypothetical protein